MLATYRLKMPGYPNLIANGMNVNKLAALLFLMSGLASVPPKQIPPDAILQRHIAASFSLALPKTIVGGLKKFLYAHNRRIMCSVLKQSVETGHKSKSV